MPARILAACAALLTLLIAVPAAAADDGSQVVVERRFTNLAYPGTCLQANSFQETMEVAPCEDGNAYQVWYTVQSEPGAPMRIVNKANGNCLDTESGAVYHFRCDDRWVSQLWAESLSGPGQARTYDNLDFPGRLTQVSLGAVHVQRGVNGPQVLWFP